MAEVGIRLLGRPSIERSDGDHRQPRGRKAWALLAYLVIQQTAVPRARLATMLFPDAEDPLGALRWNLSELRKALGPDVVLGGDPLIHRLPRTYTCDVHAATGVQEPGMADLRAPETELLEGLSFVDCPAFDTWLAIERHRIRHCVQTLVYEAALAALASGTPNEAAALASKAIELDPFNADFHAVLVRALVAEGDRAAAREQADRCAELFRQELGVGMPPEVQRALTAPAFRIAGEIPAMAVTVHSYLDAAHSCLSAGAVDPALNHLRSAVTLAELASDDDLRAEALLALAGALIHSAGGRGTEVADLLHRALSFTPLGVSRLAAGAYRELGFLFTQRGTPARAARWLAQAMQVAEGMPDEQARILGVKGMMATDIGQYETALAVLQRSDELAADLGMGRQQGFTAAMIGRAQLLLGDYSAAAASLDRSLATMAAEHWTAFVPFVESLRAETYLILGQQNEAERMVHHAAVLAESSGDRCYMDAAANAEARVHIAGGDVGAAAQWIARGLQPNPWYSWFRARVLDTACQLAIDTNSDDALGYAEDLTELASRCGLRELAVRGHSHRALLGDTPSAEAIPLLAREIQNPLLHSFLAARNQF